MEKLIMSLLAKDPADRPSSAPALSRELAAIARDHGFATTSPSLPSLAQPLPPVADDHPALESKFAVDVEVSGTATILKDPTTLSGAANSKPIAHAPETPPSARVDCDCSGRARRWARARADDQQLRRR